MKGRCSCGAIRYRMSRPPMFVHCCHCSWCQRETGSAFVLNALLETAQLVVEGAPAMRMIPSASGRGQEIARCPHCQVVLFSHYAGLGRRLAFVRVGTLEDPAAFPPDIHIFTSTKLPWVILGDGKPQVPEYYAAGEVWPAASLARRQALLDT